MKIKFINAKIITSDNDFLVINNGELMVEDNIIKKIINNDINNNYSYENVLSEASDKLIKKEKVTITSDNNFDKIIDCKGNILMPGLINSHAHSAMTLFRGSADNYEFFDWWQNFMLPKEKLLTFDDIYLGSKIAVNEMVENGITTFFDCYFMPEATIKAASELGMRVGVAFGAISGEDEVSQDLLETKYNKLKSYDNVYPFLYAHSVYSCDEYQFAELLKFAKKHNLVFSTHVSETLKEVGQVHNQTGMTPVELLESYGMFDVPCVLAHMVHADKDDVEIIKNYDVSISHNPASNLKLGSGIAPLYSFLKNGINVSLGTDGAASNNNLDILKEMYLAANLQYGVLNDTKTVNSSDVIKMATINAANAFKLKNIGAIKEGWFADIIMINANDYNMIPSHNIANNVVFSATNKNVIMTMINGDIAYSNFN